MLVCELLLGFENTLQIKALSALGAFVTLVTNHCHSSCLFDLLPDLLCDSCALPYDITFTMVL